MAINQISTSVSILNTGLSGFLGVSLTNYETSTLSAIAAGSCFEIGGAFFLCQSETAINTSSWTAITTATTAYLALTPSGTAGSQLVTPSWTATPPVWSESKQGWYASAASIVRVIGSAYKISNTQQETKTLYIKGRDRIFQLKINIGPWNMDANDYPDSTFLNVDFTKIFSAQAWILNDALNSCLPLVMAASGGNTGIIGIYPTYFIVQRFIGSIFDSTNYNDAVMNRGYVIVTYEA
jgi:hypothetical protein